MTLTRSSLRLGYFIPALFWATTIICGAVLGDYNHLRRLVSELGALGTPTQLIFSGGLVLCALLGIPFIIALATRCREEHVSPIPVLLVLAFSVSIGGAALFPLPLRLHLYLGLPSILLVLSPPLGLVLWSDSTRLRPIRPYAVIALGLMALGFLAFFPDILGGYAGLKQRVFHAGWGIWFVGLSRVFGGRL